MAISVANGCTGTGKEIQRQHKSAWFQFMKSIISFKGDLANLSAPPFILSPESICQFSQYFSEYPNLLVAPAKETDAQRRALLVLKWFLATLRRQHSTTLDDGSKRKLKPLNPFLGEIYLGKWVDEAGTTELISEQVSHHPPQTAYCIRNEEHGVTLEGHVAPKSYFSHTINIERQGHGRLRLDKYAEDYVFTMPTVHVEGIMTFQIAPELGGTSYIHSSSGYTASIDYSSKGWLKGKSNSFKATLFRDGAEGGAPLYTLEGQWSGSYTIRDGAGKLIETVDLLSLRPTPLQVAPVEKQHPLETGRAWQQVIDAIDRCDYLAIGQEKSKVENAQRALRQQEKAEGREWERRYFTMATEHAKVDALALDQGCQKRDRVFWNFNHTT
ncbi:hypothetical protein BX600DRAFT_461904 [Xylariales sp. PMI_506]|nr:hypothetical protein BX600DRAFT_461904 [Xylariales sp. PMI_506]